MILAISIFVYHQGSYCVVQVCVRPHERVIENWYGWGDHVYKFELGGAYKSSLT